MHKPFTFTVVKPCPKSIANDSDGLLSVHSLRSYNIGREKLTKLHIDQSASCSISPAIAIANRIAGGIAVFEDFHPTTCAYDDRLGTNDNGLSVYQTNPDCPHTFALSYKHVGDINVIHHRYVRMFEKLPFHNLNHLPACRPIGKRISTPGL